MNEVSVIVPNGIGDNFWIYQKLSPYFDRINMKVAVVADDALQRRSFPWLKILPKVGSIEPVLVRGDQYDALAKMRKPLKQFLSEHAANPNAAHEYCLNQPLEDGVRLEDIDGPDYDVDWTFDLPGQPQEGNHNILYVSGSTHHGEPQRLGCWNSAQWAACYEQCLQRLDSRTERLYIIGAVYDMPVMVEVANLLSYLDPIVICNERPERVLGIMKSAKFMLGYQSGMCILADYLNVLQLMIYYPHLEGMMHTWCRPGNFNTRHFTATFNEGAILSPEKLPLNALTPK